MSETVNIDEELLTIVSELNIDSRSDVPTISSKRPFGNSDYYYDILRLTDNLEEHTNEHGEIEDTGKEIVEDYLDRLSPALEILSQNLELEEGVYKRQSNLDEWKLSENLD